MKTLYFVFHNGNNIQKLHLLSDNPASVLSGVIQSLI